MLISDERMRDITFGYRGWSGRVKYFEEIPPEDRNGIGLTFQLGLIEVMPPSVRHKSSG